MDNKEEMIKLVKDMMNANSCCNELKEVSKKWLNSIGTENEGKVTEELKNEIKEDITSIDDLIDLCSSDTGKNIFGEDVAENMVKRGKEDKANGKKYCFCDACRNAEQILDILKA